MFYPRLFWRLQRHCQRDSWRFEKSVKDQACWYFHKASSQPTPSSGWYSFLLPHSEGDNKFWMKFNGMKYKTEKEAFEGLLSLIEQNKPKSSYSQVKNYHSVTSGVIRPRLLPPIGTIVSYDYCSYKNGIHFDGRRVFTVEKHLDNQTMIVRQGADHITMSLSKFADIVTSHFNNCEIILPKKDSFPPVGSVIEFTSDGKLYDLLVTEIHDSEMILEDHLGNKRVSRKEMWEEFKRVYNPVIKSQEDIQNEIDEMISLFNLPDSFKL